MLHELRTANPREVPLEENTSGIEKAQVVCGRVTWRMCLCCRDPQRMDMYHCAGSKETFPIKVCAVDKIAFGALSDSSNLDAHLRSPNWTGI